MNKKEFSDNEASNDHQTASDANNNECEARKSAATQKDLIRKAKHDLYDSEQDRKLFIGYGVNLSITEAVLEDFFKKFGEIERVVIKRDVVTSKPRGFAFITMAKPEHVEKVLNSCPLSIKGKEVDIMLAKSRPISKKVFVGGIDPNLTKENVIEVFSQFGKVVEVELPYDRLKKKRREFCFVIFESEEGANFASEKPKQIIFGRECDVKKATPQPIAQQLKRNQQNLQQSFNSAAHSQNSNHYYGGPNTLNHSRNHSKPLFPSPNSVKSGSGGYRDGYKGKHPMNRSGHFNQNGRKSVDSQYNTIYEYNNSGSNNTSFNGRKSVNQHHLNQSRQYLSNSVPNVAGNLANNNINKSFNQQHNKQQQMQLTNQQQLYYEQLAGQNFYGYQTMPYNDYYAALPHYPGQHTTTSQQTTNAANSQYLTQQPNHLDYYNHYAQYYPTPPAHQAIQQYTNSINQCYTNYQSANQVGSIDSTTLQQPQQQSTTDPNYQSLEDHYYSEQQKQIENNLMNNFEEKYDGQDIVTNYQPQLMNNNLLTLPYQGSIQQC